MVNRKSQGLSINFIFIKFNIKLNKTIMINGSSIEILFHDQDMKH